MEPSTDAGAALLSPDGEALLTTGDAEASVVGVFELQPPRIPSPIMAAKNKARNFLVSLRMYKSSKNYIFSR
jgi:hypothetical protein